MSHVIPILEHVKLHLGMPWSMLPTAAQKHFKDLCTEIHFYDGGRVVKNHGEWGPCDQGRSDEAVGFLGR